jgi:hypothetical protein
MNDDPTEGDESPLDGPSLAQTGSDAPQEPARIGRAAAGLFVPQAARVEIARLLGLALPADRVTLDPRNVSPPCIVVGLPRVLGVQSGHCRATLELPVFLVTPPPGNADSVEWMLERLATVMSVCGATTADPMQYSPSPTVDLPAYEVTATINVTTVSTSKENP